VDVYGCPVDLDVPPVESVTEWGVRWRDVDAVSACADERQARDWAATFDADSRPTVVCRTVTRAEWREVARSEDESPAQYDRRLCRSCQQPEWPTHVADASGGTVKHPYVARVGTDG
jgi:hypothetical protein